MMSLDSGKFSPDFFSTSLQRALVGFLLLGTLSFSTSVLACSTDAWDAVTGGTTTNKRYVDDCGYAPSTTTVGEYVQDTIDGGASAYVVSFYALTQFNLNDNPTVANTVTIFSGLDSSSVSLLSVVVRGDDTAILTTPGGSTPTPIAINTGENFNGWNHYKITWGVGASASLSINGGSAATISAGTTSTLSTARLGHIASSSPNLNALGFDQFVSLRVDSADTNPLCPGDTDGNLSRTFADANAIFNEFSSGGINRASGQPDFDGDGSISFADANETFKKFSTGQGACP